MGSSLNKQLRLEPVIFLKQLFRSALHEGQFVFDAAGSIGLPQMERLTHV